MTLRSCLYRTSSGGFASAQEFSTFTATVGAKLKSLASLHKSLVFLTEGNFADSYFVTFALTIRGRTCDELFQAARAWWEKFHGAVRVALARKER